MATSRIGTSPASHAGSIRVTANAPPAEPANAAAAGSAKRRRSMWPLRANANTAPPVPNVLCNLLVAKAATGGTPTAISAGMVSSPPPPAIASMNPARNATAIRKAMISGPSCMISY